jgi:PhzF family phenazine biosynthesis protein
MPEIPCFQIDAFTDRPFAGNPAAVCLLESEPGEQWMQAVAAEMNLSETAFVHPRRDGFELRWFTPAIEVDLCGHATLAAAHALWEQHIVADDEPIEFHTRSGVLVCTKRGALIELDFPATPVTPADASVELCDALGTTAAFVGQSRFDRLVLVDDEKTVRALQPDFSRLRELPVRGVIVTSASDNDQFDFVSRFFAPAAGVDEDPVTGSAHCALGPFWGDRLGKDTLSAYQASARGGAVGVRLAGDRVILSGPAITVFSGLLIKPSQRRHPR